MVLIVIAACNYWSVVSKTHTAPFELTRHDKRSNWANILQETAAGQTVWSAAGCRDVVNDSYLRLCHTWDFDIMIEADVCSLSHSDIQPTKVILAVGISYERNATTHVIWYYKCPWVLNRFKDMLIRHRVCHIIHVMLSPLLSCEHNCSIWEISTLWLHDIVDECLNHRREFLHQFR